MKHLLNNLVPPSSGERFPALDGLRALACFLVMFSHLEILQKHPIGQAGKIGLCIFFVLSGFLLSYRWAAGKPPDILSYFGRRVWRIYPLYLAALIFGIFTMLIRGLPVSTTDIASHLFFLHTWFPQFAHSIVGPAWALPAEIQFYVLLPLIAFAIFPRRQLLLLPLIILAIAVQAFTPKSGQGWENLPALLLPFLCGIAGAVLFSRSRRCFAFCFIGIAGMITMNHLPHMAFGLDWLRAGGITRALMHPFGPFTSLAATALIVGLTSARSGIILWLFSNRPIRLLGSASFGIFLFHRPLLHLLDLWLSPLGIALVGIPLSIALGFLGFRYIENPMIRFSRKSPSLMFASAKHLHPTSLNIS